MEKIIFFEKNPTLRKLYSSNLEKCGFEVYDFFENNEVPLFKKNYFHKLINIFHRIVLKDKNYLFRIEKKTNLKLLSELISRTVNEKYTTALFIRADVYNREIVQKVSHYCIKLICYQYDGMQACQNLLRYSDLFDKIYVFDPSDLQQYKSLNFLPLTNCWFDDDTDESKVETDIFYVGVGVPERLRLADKIKEYCTSSHIRLRAVLTIPAHYPEKEEEGVFLSHSGLSYEENILEVKKSKAVLDFKLPYHNSLSFRFFEAMKYKKKVITNNSSVQYYDFYHPDNIFITDFENLDGLKEFLEKPYHEIDENIVQKYGFKNWTHYVLDLPPYQKIDLPKT